LPVYVLPVTLLLRLLIYVRCAFIRLRLRVTIYPFGCVTFVVVVVAVTRYTLCVALPLFTLPLRYVVTFVVRCRCYVVAVVAPVYGWIAVTRCHVGFVGCCCCPVGCTPFVTLRLRLYGCWFPVTFGYVTRLRCARLFYARLRLVTLRWLRYTRAFVYVYVYVYICPRTYARYGYVYVWLPTHVVVCTFVGYGCLVTRLLRCLVYVYGCFDVDLRWLFTRLFTRLRVALTLRYVTFTPHVGCCVVYTRSLRCYVYCVYVLRLFYVCYAVALYFTFDLLLPRLRLRFIYVGCCVYVVVPHVWLRYVGYVPTRLLIGLRLVVYV